MHEQRGLFQGIDTCSITQFGYFSFTSVILDESEGISIEMRPGINYLLLTLQREIHL